MAWVRSVKLYGDADAWVLAKSIFPFVITDRFISTPKSTGCNAHRICFVQKRQQLPIKRHFYRYDGQIGRQTVYDINGRKILIDELFLAAFQASFDQ